MYLWVYLTVEIVLARPNPLRPHAPRSHMHTGPLVIATNPILCLSRRGKCTYVFLTAEKVLASPHPPRPTDGIFNIFTDNMFLWLKHYHRIRVICVTLCASAPKD
jgi:hypothetical protein